MSSPIEFLATSASCQRSKRKMWHPKNERSKSCRVAQNHACPIQSFIWQYWCQYESIIVMASCIVGPKGSCEWSKTAPCHRWRQSARNCNNEQYEEDSACLNSLPLPATSHSLTHQSIERQKIGLMSSPIEFLATSASCERSKRKMWHPQNF